MRSSGSRSAAFLALLAAGAPGGAGAIVGGVETSEYPEVVALSWDGWFMCSGLLVGARKALTSAHCVYGYEGTEADWELRIGSDAASPDSVVGVEELIVHPDHATQADSDIAVVLLSADAPVPPVPWNTEDPADAWFDLPVTFVGFGRTAADDESGVVRKRVADSVLSDFTETSIRWDDTDHGVCEGDSGGPAYVDLGGGPVPAGIIEGGDPDCMEYGTAVRTDAYAAWLQDPHSDPVDDDDADDDAGGFGDDDGGLPYEDGCACFGTLAGRDRPREATEPRAEGRRAGWDALLGLGLVLLGLSRSSRRSRPRPRAERPLPS